MTIKLNHLKETEHSSLHSIYYRACIRLLSFLLSVPDKLAKKGCLLCIIVSAPSSSLLLVFFNIL